MAAKLKAAGAVRVFPVVGKKGAAPVAPLKAVVRDAEPFEESDEPEEADS